MLFLCAADISAANLLLPQVTALEKAGFEAHIACADGPHVGRMRELGFEVRTVQILNRTSPLANLKSVLALRTLMRREGYGVVHVHMISAGFLGRVAARMARVPFIFYTFRGFAFYEGSSRRLKVFNLFIERLCTPWTSWFFSQSEENRQRAIRHRVMPEERSAAIGNGIALAEFKREREESELLSNAVRKELGIDKEAFVVGFVGRLVTEKGVIELLEAAFQVLERRPAMTFLIVGDALPSDEGMRPRMAELIRSSGFESRFVLTGWRSDVARLYHAMDLFVLPSYREGMPRSIMEAMAAGKPVVASDIAGCRDEIVDGVTGILVAPRDAQQLSEAIDKVIGDPSLARMMGLAGRDRAERLFDECDVCERLVTQYQKILLQSSPQIATRRVELLLKRILDYMLAVPAIVALAPLFLMIGIAIKVDSAGPVLFKQTREGKGRRPFRIIKFRTMQVDAERFGLEIRKDDERITRVGRVLRKTSLDELPQLLNVLRGEMSLVGPRPLLPGTTRDEEERRLWLRPGITSYPALFGRHALDWEDRMPLDLWYIDHWSLRLDLMILVRTIPIVLSAENIYDAKGGSHFRSKSGESIETDEIGVVDCKR